MTRTSPSHLLLLSFGALLLGACGGGTASDPAPAPAPQSTSAVQSSSTATEVDLTGDWTLTVRLDTGEGRRQLTLIQDGNDLAGTISSSRATGEVTGSVEGDRVRFVAVLAMTGGDFEVIYEARVVGDRLVEGTVEIPGYSAGTFTGVRRGML